METVVVGVALILLGVSGITFRGVFASLSRSPSSPVRVASVLPIIQWRRWIIFELAMVAAGVVVLINGAA